MEMIRCELAGFRKINMRTMTNDICGFIGHTNQDVMVTVDGSLPVEECLISKAPPPIRRRNVQPLVHQHWGVRRRCKQDGGSDLRPVWSRI